MSRPDPYHIDLIRLILTHWRRIFIPAIIVSVVTAVMMLLLPDFYRSETSFYPLKDHVGLGISSQQQGELKYYGGNDEMDRVLNVGTSSSFIYDFAISEALDRTYNIDISANKGRHKLLIKVKKLYALHKSDRDAITLSMEDKNPERAQELTLSAFSKLSDKITALNKQGLMEMYDAAESNREQLSSVIGQLSEELREIRLRYGVYDTQSQGEWLAKQEGSGSNARTAEKIKLYSEGVGKVKQLEASIEEYARQLAYAGSHAARLSQAIEREVPVFQVVESAQLPFKKSRPIRSLYVLAAFSLTAFMSIVGLLIRAGLNND